MAKTNKKPDPKKKDDSVITDALNLLDVPQKATMNLLFGEYAKPSELMTGNEIGSKIIGKENYGLLADLVLDPLNVVPYSKLTKAGNFIKDFNKIEKANKIKKVGNAIFLADKIDDASDIEESSFYENAISRLKMYKDGGHINFSNMNIDAILSGINLMADISQSAVNSIKGEYDIAALAKQTNPYFAEKGGNVSGAREFKAPSHEDGGLGITADGAVSNNPDAEIEKDEILYKFRIIPEGDYVFSSANGTASLAREILDKYRINSTKGKGQDIDNDSLTRAKMEMELKAIVDKNEAMNAQKQSLAAQFIQKYGGHVKKMFPGGYIDYTTEKPVDLSGDIVHQVDPSILESTEALNLNTDDEFGFTRTSPSLRTLKPEDMRANGPITYDTSKDVKKRSKLSNFFSSANKDSNLGGSKGALARGSAVFLDALDMLKKPLKESLIAPDFGPSDAAMRSLSADLTEAEQSIYSGYNAATDQNRNVSNSLQQLSARQQGLTAGLTDSMMKVAAQKRAMLNQIAEKQATYEAGKAGTIAEAKYQNRLDNLQNEAARQQFVERARDNMIQIGANLDKMDIAQKTTAEGNRLLASYGNYYNVEFDENGNPSEIRIKVAR